jgi:uncharacterized membrane protein YjjP (DUF1212 family)
VNQENDLNKKIIELCLLAGKIMLKSGAETRRAEDTMRRIASSFGIHDSQSFVTPTAIMFSLSEADPTKLVRISVRSTDLQKVAIVNDISRKIHSGDLKIEEALKELKAVAKADLSYPVWLQIVAASFVSSCFLIMFKGGWGDFLPASIAGGAGYAVFIYVHKMIKLKYVSEFVSALVIGVIAYFAILSGWGTAMDKIIIGSVMPLVPGVLITNAVRDLMDGHFISALSKSAESFLTSIAIGTGIALVFLLP